MKIKLLHPLWTHIPAIGALVFIIVYTIVSGPLPSTAATHFDFHGVPNDWGSPYLGFGIIVGLSFLFIALSIFFDELWAKQEKGKKFNWFSLFDELTVGFLVGDYAGYIQYLKSGDSTFGFPWVLTFSIMGGLLILAVLLDFLRPFRPNPQKVTFSDTTRLEKDLEEKLKHNESFMYWQSQNPVWVTLLSIGLPVIMLAAAVVVWFEIPWVALVVALSGIMSVCMYGGLQTTVTRQEITVSFGIIGSKVLKLKTKEIASVELMDFAPIADFGGYGIRRNKEMWAYYMRGNKGIKLTTTNGKKFLIGSDKPEELYAVVQAVVKEK
ncbi:MAG: SdpI family protein [Dehalococcoidales bacterium]